MDGAALRKVFVKNKSSGMHETYYNIENNLFCARVSGREVRLEENRAAQGPKDEDARKKKKTDFRVFH